MNAVRNFISNYKHCKKILAAVKNKKLDFEKIASVYGDRYKSIEEFVEELNELIRQHEANILIFYKADGMVNESEFNKYYAEFTSADESKKEFYEKANGRKYEDILGDLNAIKNAFAEYEARKGEALSVESDALKQSIDDRKKLKKELVERGIAKDDGCWNVIEVAPERFVDYLKYMEEHYGIK